MGASHAADARTPLFFPAVAAIALAVLLPLFPAQPAAASTTFTFDGGGWGHSVGLSQYGALGMSQEGYSWDQILIHYFTGEIAEALVELEHDRGCRTKIGVKVDGDLSKLWRNWSHGLHRQTEPARLNIGFLLFGDQVLSSHQ